jgi:hypothetical protein
MGGATYILPQSVPANSQIDISVAMTAPSKTGSIRGNWRMSTVAGQFFGDEVYLVIFVGGTNTGVPAAETSTPGPTATETPIP